MNEPVRRKRGIIRISIDSIIKALYGNVGYEAVSARLARGNPRMLEITVSHPTLPEWHPGKRIQRIEIKRRYEDG
jgi:hypothetical protein